MKNIDENVAVFVSPIVRMSVATLADDLHLHPTLSRSVRENVDANGRVLELLLLHRWLVRHDLEAIFTQTEVSPSAEDHLLEARTFAFVPGHDEELFEGLNERMDV